MRYPTCTGDRAYLTFLRTAILKINQHTNSRVVKVDGADFVFVADV